MQILVILGVTAFLVVFGLQNSAHVPVSFVLGSPTKVRLCFLLMISAGVGFLFSYIRALNREIELKKKIRKLAIIKSDTLTQLPGSKQRNGRDF